jgi:hypothetical protein
MEDQRLLHISRVPELVVQPRVQGKIPPKLGLDRKPVHLIKAEQNLVLQDPSLPPTIEPRP